ANAIVGRYGYRVAHARTTQHVLWRRRYRKWDSSVVPGRTLTTVQIFRLSRYCPEIYSAIEHERSSVKRWGCCWGGAVTCVMNRCRTGGRIRNRNERARRINSKDWAKGWGR